MTAAPPPQLKGHRWFAAVYDVLNRGGERRLFAPLRTQIAGGATGQVLEVGAGTGANFPYYTDNAERIVATEPDPFMLRRAQKRAKDGGFRIELHPYPVEALPFPDASFDTVVCTFVLCTVAGPERALAEVRRVLKPEGSFRFIEHVRAAGGMGTVQDVLTPLWSWVGAGCHPNRATGPTIQAAGFVITELNELRPMPLIPIISGVAKPL